MSNARPIAIVTFLAICLLSVFLTGGRYGYVVPPTAVAAGTGEPARGTFESVDVAGGILRDRLPGLKKDRAEQPSAAGFDGDGAQPSQAVSEMVRFAFAPAIWPRNAAHDARAPALDNHPPTGPPLV